MKKKKLILVLVPVLLLGGGAGAYFGGLIPGGKKGGEAAKEADAKSAPDKAAIKAKEHVFFPLPDLLVNLNAGGGKRTGGYLKIKINLELENKEAIPKIEAVMPRIVDNMQVYLRELRVEDVQGSEGLSRLREELLYRINTAAEPVKVTDVLFAEMLMQ